MVFILVLLELVGIFFVFVCGEGFLGFGFGGGSVVRFFYLSFCGVLESVVLVFCVWI